MSLPTNQVLCGDCIEVMQKFPDESINLVILDPPYNIGKAEWDRVKHYPHWLLARIRECQRVLKRNGSLWLFHTHFPSLAEINLMIEKETSFRFKQFITINKGLGSIAGRTSINLRSFPRATEYLVFYTFEDRTGAEQLSEKYRKINPMAHYLKSEFKRARVTNKEMARLFPSRTGGLTGCIFNWLMGLNFPLKLQYEKMREYLNRKHFDGEYLKREYEDLKREYEEERYPFHLKKGITDVWNINFYENLTQTHPCVKPCRLIMRIIDATTNPNDVVLDPFVGSGTTCVASQKLGRKWIGIDINPEYVEMAKKRLMKECSQKLTKFW